MPLGIRIVQQNVCGCAQATANLLSFAQDEGVDLVTVHEPPAPSEIAALWREQPKCLPSTARLYLGSVSQAELEHSAPTALTIVTNPDLQIERVTEFSHEGCVCLELGFLGSKHRLYLVNLHMPPVTHSKSVTSSVDGNLEPCLGQLNSMLEELEQHELVVCCLDTNAVSPWWSYSDEPDERGDLIEDLILARGFCVANTKEATLASAREDCGELTLVSPDLINRVGNWHAEDDCLAPGHRTVGFEIHLYGLDGAQVELEEDEEVGNDPGNQLPLNDDEREARLQELRDIFGEECEDFFGDAATGDSQLLETMSVDESKCNDPECGCTDESNFGNFEAEQTSEQNDNYLEMLHWDYIDARRQALRETRKSMKVRAWVNFYRAKFVYYKQFCKQHFCLCNEIYRDTSADYLNRFEVTDFNEEDDPVTEEETDILSTKNEGPVPSKSGSTAEWFEDLVEELVEDHRAKLRSCVVVLENLL